MSEPKGIAKTSNVSNLFKMYQSLDGRSRNVPGIGLLSGDAGLGKTTAVAWLQNKTNCLVVECSPVWTPYGLLRDIATELGESPNGGAAVLLGRVVDRFKASRRGLVLDETDERLFLPGRKYLQMVDLVRSIHDRTGVPVIFVGYKQMLQTVSRFPQLDGRVTQVVEFETLTVADTKLFAAAVSPGLKLADCLVELLFSCTGGRPRQTVTALETIQVVQKSENWPEVTAAAWGDRKFFPGDRR